MAPSVEDTRVLTGGAVRTSVCGSSGITRIAVRRSGGVAFQRSGFVGADAIVSDWGVSDSGLSAAVDGCLLAGAGCRSGDGTSSFASSAAGSRTDDSMDMAGSAAATLLSGLLSASG